MRIVYIDEKHSIEEPETRYSTLVDAVSALDRLFKEGLSSFGQILSNDGCVLQNLAPSRSSSAATEETAVSSAS
jgi:hypothetical protein